MADCDVRYKNRPASTSSFRNLTKDEVKALVASGLQDRVLATDIETVAGELGCTPKTVRAALSHESLLEADKLGNLMARDPSVFHAWFKELGLRVTFTDSEMTPDMVTASHMSRALTAFIRALEDGNRDHRETLELATIIKPLIPRLSAICHEADDIRRPRVVA